MPRRPSLSDSVRTLLADRIDSAEQLEILLLLRRSPEKAFNARAVVSSVLVTPASAEKHLALLCGRGFLGVSIGSDLVYTYKPASDELDAALSELASVYRQHRSAIVETLREREPTDPVRAFAEAFRIRKEGDDG